MKKIISLAMAVFMLTGCNIEVITQDESKYVQDNDEYDFILDKETCIEYIIFNSYKKGLSARYNADGTIKLNEECLNDK